jgi:hypothetical protein
MSQLCREKDVCQMNGKRFLSKLKRQATYSLYKQCKSGLPIANDFKVLGIETSCGMLKQIIATITLLVPL